MFPGAGTSPLRPARGRKVAPRRESRGAAPESRGVESTAGRGPRISRAPELAVFRTWADDSVFHR